MEKYKFRRALLAAIFAVSALQIAQYAHAEPGGKPPQEVVKIYAPAKKNAQGLVTEPPTVYYTGLLKPAKAFADNAPKLDLSDDPACANLPESFMLSSLTPNPVPPVRNQGSCGSCWSFSKTGAFESWLITTGKGAFDVAEQELVSNDSQNYGCGGGNLNSREYQYSHGQGLEKDFPYTARDSSSREITPVGKMDMPSYEVVAGSGQTKVRNMQCALFKYHTIPWVTVGADGDWGSPPTSDGAVWTRCSNNGTNHAIGYDGWKTVNGTVYFHAKNSWGESWGEHGYAWLPLGCDGFGEEVAFLPANPKPALALHAPLEVVAIAGTDVPLDVPAQDGLSVSWSTGGTGPTAWLKSVAGAQSVVVTGTKGDVQVSATIKLTVL